MCAACVDAADESGRHSYEASVDVGREPDWTNEADVIQHLVCLAVLGIEDPVRAQVSACPSIRDLSSAPAGNAARTL